MLQLIRFPHVDLLKNIPKYFVAYASQKCFRFSDRLWLENINYPDFLIGINRIGYMDQKAILSTLYYYGLEANYEFIFHPGHAGIDEFPREFHNTLPLNFTTSEWRKKEKNSLLTFAQENKRLVSELQKQKRIFLSPIKQQAAL